MGGALLLQPKINLDAAFDWDGLQRLVDRDLYAAAFLARLRDIIETRDWEAEL